MADSKISELRVFSEQTFSADIQKSCRRKSSPQPFLTLPKGMGNLRFQAIHNFQYRTMQQFFGQMPLLKTEMDRWRKQNRLL